MQVCRHVATQEGVSARGQSSKPGTPAQVTSQHSSSLIATPIIGSMSRPLDFLWNPEEQVHSSQYCLSQHISFVVITPISSGIDA